jgi:ATP-dependent Clp protease ATP-binding subunit ClpC
VGTEHILLGLLRSSEGAASSALASLGITYQRVRPAVIGMMGVGVEADARELPMTDPAQRVIDRARQQASTLGADSVGTEHLLLALVREPSGAAARILLQMDADSETIRAALTSAG